MKITTDRIIRAVTAARDSYVNNARQLIDDHHHQDDAFAEITRASKLNSLLADEDICEMLARKLGDEP
jgi:hypothetical protein